MRFSETWSWSTGDASRICTSDIYVTTIVIVDKNARKKRVMSWEHDTLLLAHRIYQLLLLSLIRACEGGTWQRRLPSSLPNTCLQLAQSLIPHHVGLIWNSNSYFFTSPSIIRNPRSVYWCRMCFCLKIISNWIIISLYVLVWTREFQCISWNKIA